MKFNVKAFYMFHIVKINECISNITFVLKRIKKKKNYNKFQINTVKSIGR